MILNPIIWMAPHPPLASNQSFYLEFNLNLKETNGEKTN